MSPLTTPAKQRCLTESLPEDEDEDVEDASDTKTRRKRSTGNANKKQSFTAAFVVPMNKIDLKNSAFTKLNENPLVFATMLVLMCLYLVVCIWARKADKMDELLVKIITF